MSCVEMEKNNSGVLAGKDNNNTVQYSAESDRNVTALRKEPISVAQLGLVRRRYGGVSTVAYRGGVGVFKTLPPRNSECPPKSCQTQPDCENC